MVVCVELYGLYGSLESTFFEKRLVFSPSADGIHPDKLALRERGIRIATIFHRIFGKSTTVLIDGKSYILNTNSLNKYCDKMFKLGGVNDSLKQRVQVIANASLENPSSSLPSLMGEELLRLHLGNNSVEVIDAGSRPLKTISRSLSFSSISDVSEKNAKVKAEFEKAEIELKKATETLKAFENNRLIENSAEIGMSLIDYAGFAHKEIKELISLLIDNEDITPETVKAKLPEIKAFIEKLAAEKNIDPELVKSFINNTELLITSALNIIEASYDSYMKSGNYLLAKMVTLYMLLAKVLPDLQLVEKKMPIVISQGELLYEKIQEEIKPKKQLFPRIAKFRTDIIVSQVWANRARVYKVAKKNLQGIVSAELPQASSHFSRMRNKIGASILGIIGRTILNNQETAINKLIECIQKDFKKAQVKRRLSDTELLEAEKAYTIAKKNYDSKKRAFESLKQVPVNSNSSELEIPLD